MSTYGLVRPSSASACRVTANYQPGAALFHVQGDLDSVTAAGLRQELGASVGQPAVLLDLTGVDFIDSIGLGALVSVIRRIHERDGRVAISGADARRGIAAALVGAGIDRLVFIAGTSPEGLDWLLGCQDVALR